SLSNTTSTSLEYLTIFSGYPNSSSKILSEIVGYGSFNQGQGYYDSNCPNTDEGLDKFLRLKLLQQPKSLRFVLTKVAMDGIIFGPLDLFVFFTYMGFSMGKNVQQGGVWPIVQVVNFRYVPVRYQFLYVNIFCLMDSAFMSWVEQLKDAAWKQWFTSFSLKERGGQGRL
ncbi:hypothetical protein UlMin_029489, partial [Ulmus minor]